ncbi:shikimate kinase [Marinitoga sp. 1138]|uniref:shikimate kinase n=1 Tax=Marinitoga sp. 1138 TaxID=1643334 RepID=UPI001586F4A6|nr:hypothetical protein [Marinitoga sp. 1138]
MPIYLIGMMGSGKTTLGNKLSKILNMSFIDLDKEIEKIENTTINNLFSKKGEEYFRNLESKVLKNTEGKNAIVATGGGIVLKKENRLFLKNHKTIFLYVPVEDLIKRINPDNRPLLKDGKDRLYKIWDMRKALYNEFKKIDLSNLNIQESLAKILYEIIDEKEEILENDFQEVIIKYKGLMDLKNKKYVFASKNVYRIYREFFNKPFLLKEGEEKKDYKNLEYIYQYLIENEISRKDEIYGVGGGSVTDLTGFIGSTFKRGLDFYFYPTTLLSQIDASIGGKTGINFSKIKNVIGTFSIPEKVIIDPITIISQDEKNYLSGIIEGFKIAIIDGNTSLFTENIEKIKNRNLNILEKIIKYAAITKLKIVSKDPYDNNIRRLLNLGHTFGHGFESITGITHGLSVGWGIKKEIELFEDKIKEKDKKIILNFLKKILPEEIFKKDIPTEKLKNYIIQDKKINNNSIIDFPIIKSIGNVELEKIKITDIIK